MGVVVSPSSLTLHGPVTARTRTVIRTRARTGTMTIMSVCHTWLGAVAPLSLFDREWCCLTARTRPTARNTYTSYTRRVKLGDKRAKRAQIGTGVFALTAQQHHQSKEGRGRLYKTKHQNKGAGNEERHRRGQQSMYPTEGRVIRYHLQAQMGLLIVGI